MNSETISVKQSCQPLRTPPRSPGFFWQGVLIVLPSALLAAFGLYSLRQDRLLAEQPAAQLAQQLADGLAHSVLPKALNLDLLLSSLPDDVEQFIGGGWRRPMDEPLARWGDFLGCLVKPTGVNPVAKSGWPPVLLYPPPVAPLPPPNLLDSESLSPLLRTLWELASTNLHDGRYSEAAEAMQQFLMNSPPEPFGGIARYRLAVCGLRAGDLPAARTNLSALVLKHSDARGETGLPLAPFAQLQIMELDRQASASNMVTNASAVPTPPDITLINEVGSYALLQPSPFSSQLLDRLCSVAGEYGQTWKRLWTVHERSRRFFESFLARTNAPMLDEPRSFWLENESAQGMLARWIPVAGRASGALDQKYWLVVWPRNRLEEALRASLSSQVLPKYLSFGVEVAGVDLIGGPGAHPVLATSSGGGIGAVPEFRVKVYLTDRAMLFASLQARRLWFGALITMASGAVMVGFLTAWRAFRRQQQLAEMKGNFVSAVSHELRAPIAAIRLMSEELEDIGPMEPAKSEEYHRLIKQECRRLSALIENVLDFSRHDQGRKEYVFEPTHLVALVEETVKVMQPCGLERRITLTTAHRGSPLPVAVDGRAIQQALVNLIDNAIKHSPDGATVAIGLEVDSVPLSPKPLRHKEEAPSSLRLWVEDHGEGIPPEDHEPIFERFYRRGSELRRETQGIGLGLAIVKYVTEAHGGKVTVRSAKVEGSRFTMELPISNEAESASVDD